MAYHEPREEDPAFSEEKPWLYGTHPIAHYYGDIVRQLLLLAAAVILVAAPFYASDLPRELPLNVLAALVLACLAAFTSPQAATILYADAIVSGVGMVLFELWALSSYQDTSIVAVGLRQAIALIFLFALYFSGKTLRGRALGRRERVADEGDTDDEDAEDAERAGEEIDAERDTDEESGLWPTERSEDKDD